MAAPPVNSRIEMPTASKEHEMHYRGELMVIERLLSITPHVTRQMEQPMAAMRSAAPAAS